MIYKVSVVTPLPPYTPLQVGKPQEVKDAEQASSPVSDDTILKVITAFNVGVGKYTKLVRRLLPAYGGYECKEPESGKFTLSFRYDYSHMLMHACI